MATVRTVTVKSSGGDYTTLNGAFSGEVGNMVSLDRQLDIVCNAIADTTMANTSSSWTTDATRFVRVKAAAGAENKGIKDQGYRLTGDGSRSLLMYMKHARFEDIQIGGADAIGFQWVGSSATDAEVIFDRCYVRCTASSGTAVSVYSAQSSGTNKLVVRNSYLIATGSSGVAFDTPTTSYVTSYILNCTLVGKLILRAPNTCYGKNVILQSVGTEDVILSYGGDGANLSLTNCASNKAIENNAGTGWNYYQTDGGNNHPSHTFTFVDAANGDYHLASNDAGAKDLGADLSANSPYAVTGDIDGVTRSGTWDIGADEYVAAGGVTMPLFLYHYMHH